jgi:glycosyltransferase involved in cell wall biosynthesis
MLIGQSKLAALRDADIWTLPSYAENFGIAVLEAMAAGLPIVISDRVDLHPQISAADAGLVVPCIAEAIASAVLLLLTNPGTRQELGSRARELARKSYSWDAIASETVDMYRAIICK